MSNEEVLPDESVLCPACGTEWDLEQPKQCRDVVRHEITRLKDALANLRRDSINFLARAREGWDHLNANNYDSESLAWKHCTALEQTIAAIDKALEGK